MAFPVQAFEQTLFLVGSVGIAFQAGRFLATRRLSPQIQQERKQTQEARAFGQQLCFSTIQALAYAFEASDPNSLGHLDCVQRTALALADALQISEEETGALRAAALLHNIGRMGIPEHLLHRAGSLTPEEHEKFRSHPILGARILAAIPFPWPVIPLVRHHAEHWDGSGYPDGLRGEAIPLGARILAVANVYSALLCARSYRAAHTPEEALAEIEQLSGTQFDPGIVAAFRKLLSQWLESRQAQTADKQLDSNAETGKSLQSRIFRMDLMASPDVRHVLDDIADAQRETLGLYVLTQAISGSLHIEAVAETLLQCTRDIVDCDGCALFLPDKDEERLRGVAAQGLNARHLLGSTATIGNYLTGRAYSRGDIIQASFLPQDLQLRAVSDEWTSFRSTIIVPLVLEGRTLGTLNLYAQEPDAFSLDTRRILRLIAAQASQAIENARRFTEAQETAYTDALTGLRNARYLREFLERELNRAQRENAPLAVLNIDLDSFKPINDTYGHATGDQVLIDVAEVLATHVRNYDLAARYAGDEFVVVLGRADRVSAEVVAEKLKRAVEGKAQKWRATDPNFPKLGISVGVALCPDDGADLQSLLCRSDAAMYADKQQRKVGRSAA